VIERRGDDGWVEQWVFGATGARMIRGTASTPRKNAHGQFLNSMGCKAELPVPLFIEHRREEPPVGEVVALRRSWASVTFEARLHRTAEADAIWREITAGSLRFVSTGMCDAVRQIMSDGTPIYQNWRLRELSLVKEPANSDCGFVVFRPPVRLAA